MEEPPASSRSLLDQARSGDVSALARLVQPMRSELARRVRAIAGPLLRERIDPEDVFQDSLMAAMRSVRKLRASELNGLRAWFLAIVRNRVLVLRREGRTRRRPRHSTALPAAQLRLRDHATLENLAQIDGEPVPPSAESCVRRPPCPDHHVAVVLHGIFDSTWDTVAFVLERRSNEAARLTHLRARDWISARLPQF